jgi:integrase
VVDLGSADRVVARRKLAKLEGEQPASPDALAGEAAKGETFAEAAKRVHAMRKAAGVVSADIERSRLRLYAESIAESAVTAVETVHANQVLDAAAAAGLSKQSVIHVRQAMRVVFGQLKREGAIKVNPVDDAELPRMKPETKRERVILTDEELAAYLAYAPEQERDRSGVRERQTMAAVARMFGGLRTGDLHALRWGQHVDTETFAAGVAPRQKSATPQLLEIPEMLRTTLRAWWQEHGSPEDGPVFPQRRGDAGGEARDKQSHAKGLRRDLMRMMGVEFRAADPRVEVRHDEPATIHHSTWAPKLKTEWSRRERELFAETTYSRPVDFHSFRRSFTTALADAGINITIAMRLAGHTSMAAHGRYVMSRVRHPHVRASAARAGERSCKRGRGLPGPCQTRRCVRFRSE